jgi:hypothetical protein
MLYYLDCLHLLRYGRTVTKDKYLKLPLGPVPAEMHEMLSSIQELESLPEADRAAFANEDELLLSEYVTIIHEPIGKNYVLTRIASLKNFEPKWFSKSEFEIMEELASLYRNTSASELVRKTHEEAPYKEAAPNGQIDLKLFLEGKISQEEINQIAYNEKLSDAISFNYQ